MEKRISLLLFATYSAQERNPFVNAFSTKKKGIDMLPTTKSRYHGVLLLFGVAVLIFVALIIFRIFFRPGFTDNPPITLVTAESKEGETILEFWCLDKDECFPSVRLGMAFDTIIPLPHVGPTFYDKPDNVYVSLWEKNNYVIWFNPQTEELKTQDVKTEIDLSLSSLYLNGRLIYANTRGEIFIIEKNAVRKIQLSLGKGSHITRLAEAENGQIIAINGNPLKIDDNKFVQVFLIDPVSGRVDEKLLSAPKFDELTPNTVLSTDKKYNGMIVSVSKDLNTLYYIYSITKDGKNLSMVLEAFDVERGIALAVNSNLQCINFMSGYSQYNGFLYSSRADTEGNTAATLINAKTLEPLINTDDIVKDELTPKLLVVPFGENFLIGTDSRIILISHGGLYIKEYPLPPSLLGKEYTIMEYRR